MEGADQQQPAEQIQQPNMIPGGDQQSFIDQQKSLAEVKKRRKE